MKGRVILERNMFTECEKEIAHIEGLTVSTFKYSTSVEALRIRNVHGYIILLPYQGQQIWDVFFDNRSLKMKNFFDEPVKSDQLLDSYGAFLFHCGALRMGCPGPEDDYPLHGELPGASYDEAALEFGDEDGEAFVTLTGSFKYTKAFGDKYRALPEVKIYENSTLFDVSMNIENLASAPMDLMYMCHVNFMPADDGEVFQMAGWNTEDMILRSSIPAHVKPTPEFLKFMDSLKENPGVTRIIRPEDEYNPEIVFYIENLGSDSTGNTHMIQKHLDSTADYISYNVETFSHTVRWILKNDDQKVMGMALPSTCYPEGYTAEKARGTVRTLNAGEKAEFKVKTGLLSSKKTSEIEKIINKHSK